MSTLGAPRAGRTDGWRSPIPAGRARLVVPVWRRVFLTDPLPRFLVVTVPLATHRLFQTSRKNPMKVQLNTDVHINGNEALAAQVSATVEQARERLREQVTRSEVHLSEENAVKRGQQDHRRMLEARLEGRQTVTVTDHAAMLEQATHDAAQKLARMLGSAPGRPHNRRGKAAVPTASETAPVLR